MDNALQLYNTSRISIGENGTASLIARNVREAEEAIAYAWAMDEGLAGARELSSWARGDLLLQAQQRFDNFDLGNAIENSQDNYKTAYRLLKTSEAWPFDLRESEVNHSVHAELALTAGLDAAERIHCLCISKEFELGTMRTRQVAKQVAKAEDSIQVLTELKESESQEDLYTKLDGDSSSNLRYLFIRDSILVASKTRPEWVSGCTIVDMRSKAILDEEGKPHNIPTDE